MCARQIFTQRLRLLDREHGSMFHSDMRNPERVEAGKQSRLVGRHGEN